MVALSPDGVLSFRGRAFALILFLVQSGASGFRIYPSPQARRYERMSAVDSTTFQQTVAELLGRIEGLNAKVTVLETSVGVNSTRIEDLSGKIDAVAAVARARPRATAGGPRARPPGSSSSTPTWWCSTRRTWSRRRSCTRLGLGLGC